ncbi:MAG: hypothetical protein WC322_06460 [Candidatus Paceibacterota bacterium]|jgi:hypothetical protein
MDRFKKAGSHFVGKGGMKCSCCAPPPGKGRKVLRRRTRKVFARITQKEINAGLVEHAEGDLK